MGKLAASRKRKRARAAADVDRLSELPDCILEDILSRVTSRQAARTSVLSRRWRQLWRAVPAWCIDIDESEFYKPPVSWRLARLFRLSVPGKGQHEEEETQDARWRFMDFGDQVTALYPSSPLDTFRLRFHHETGFLGAHGWIRRGLARRPAALFLHCDIAERNLCYEPLEFSFVGYFSSRSRAGASMRRLRTLHLSRLVLNEDFADFVANDLPVLEDLQLEGCEHAFGQIASGSLKNLTIDSWSPRFSAHVLVLSVPRVSTLRIDGSLLPVTSECEMASIVAASLTHQAGHLLRFLHGARSLDLSKLSATALLDDEEAAAAVFPNLRTLLLYDCDDVAVLRHFLQNAPKLERLTVRYGRFSSGPTRSTKRWCRSEHKTSAHRHGLTAYECKRLKSVELEFYQEHDVFELDEALGDISKEYMLPIQRSTRHGKCKVKIVYT